MNESLARYETNSKVWSINGMGINKNLVEFSNSYPYNTYFTYRSSSHGWGSWSNKWSQAIWENNQIKKEIFKFNHNMYIQCSPLIYLVVDHYPISLSLKI